LVRDLAVELQAGTGQAVEVPPFVVNAAEIGKVSAGGVFYQAAFFHGKGDETVDGHLGGLALAGLKGGQSLLGGGQALFQCQLFGEGRDTCDNKGQTTEYMGKSGHRSLPGYVIVLFQRDWSPGSSPAQTARSRRCPLCQ